MFVLGVCKEEEEEGGEGEGTCVTGAFSRSLISRSRAARFAVSISLLFVCSFGQNKEHTYGSLSLSSPFITPSSLTSAFLAILYTPLVCRHSFPLVVAVCLVYQ